MSLPNYSPSGKILFGSVPWDNRYTNVRLYNSLTEQYNDIASMMTISSSNYKYIGRNRTLKVDITADRLYHSNYCMYKNESITDGWIYCFITDVQYDNDHTSIITLETDIFQTYLYGVDWVINSCFIERETVPSEDTKYLLTNEPATNLLYTVTEQTSRMFKPAGVVIVSADKPVQNNSLIDDIVNPLGYSAEAGQICIYRGIVKGANYYYCPYLSETNPVSEMIETFINGLTWAGAVESIVAIFTVPSGINVELEQFNFNTTNTPPMLENTVQDNFQVPNRGDTVDGYTPNNSKLLYYPYTYCKLTDFQGNQSDLLYEQLGSNRISFKYVPNEQCAALVFPNLYMGVTRNLEYGFATPCGAQCSWVNDTFSTWLAQNSWGVIRDVADIAADVIGAGSSLGTANAALSNLSTGKHVSSALWGKHTSNTDEAGMLGSSGLSGSANLAETLSYMSKRPDHTKGNTNIDLMVSTGMQGVRAQRWQVRSEFAKQLDKFFDKWGYAVNNFEDVNITSRDYWNYVKTGGAVAKSTNVGTTSTAPHTRGRGTPAAALALINRAFDNGITFWHTTSDFGNYNLDNTL